MNASTGVKVHLPADDQQARWNGAVWHDPNGGYPPEWTGPRLGGRHPTVLTRCGQIVMPAVSEGCVASDLDGATCGSCLHSYGAAHLGLSGKHMTGGLTAPIDTWSQT